MPRLLPWVLLLASVVVAPRARADAPRLVVALEAALDPGDPSVIVLRARATSPEGRVVALEVGRVGGSCTVDVGGLESLAVIRCTLPSGDERELELVQAGAQVLVDTYRMPATGTRRRIARVVLARARRGWAVVPRCAATFDDPRACPPPSEPVVARDPTPCRVELELTELDEETRRARVTRHAVTPTTRAWGDADREDDRWLRVSPAPLTLARAHAMEGVSVQTIARRPVATRLLDAGALSYHFDALGRTVEVHWDPQADGREYVYRYTYACGG